MVLSEIGEKVYFRSQILERPSIGKYWNISGVPVLTENVIFSFFRTCTAGVIQKLTILERKNSLVLSNTRVPVSGTWSILFPKSALGSLLSQKNTVKNNRNFTDAVNSNYNKKSTGNRKFTGKCLYILYINGQFTVLLRIFSKFTGNWQLFYGIYPENLLPGNVPWFEKTGHFPAANFPGKSRKSHKETAREFTENPQNNRKLTVNI